jgi:hypothetical protein
MNTAQHSSANSFGDLMVSAIPTPVEAIGYLLFFCSVISVSCIICMLTLLFMPLAGLHFYVLDLVTPSL